MSAPRAARIRKLANARPAVSANDSRLVRRHEPVTHNTTYREKQIYCGSRTGIERAPQPGGNQSLPVAAFSALHIASLSGAVPNQRSNAATP